MLESLTIRNFALIRDLNFNPDKGLNVITGETGAGKSILLGALGLVLGNRAETTALLNKEQKCVIEGTFLNQNEDITALFASNDLDDPGHIILRREIAPGGKSRAFVNDTPVSLSLMREIGDRLIEIHTQNTGQLITSGQNNWPCWMTMPDTRQKFLPVPANGNCTANSKPNWKQ